MADVVHSELDIPLYREPPVSREHRVTTESRAVRYTLIGIALVFLAVFLVLPLVEVFRQAFQHGFSPFLAAVSDANTGSAILLTLFVALLAVPINLVFGIAAAWAIAKFDFRGKSVLVTLIDLPFSVSPVVSGLLFVLIFGAQGIFGPWLAAHHIKIIFAVPGIVLATIFVTFPFIARELIPLMEAQGRSDEEAALTLGASPLRMFLTVTLPNVKWGLLYGVLLCNARAMGEFGAVSVVSGRIIGGTNTMPLHIQMLYEGNDAVAAFSVATLLALLALVTLVIKTFLEWRYGDELANGSRH